MGDATPTVVSLRHLPAGKVLTVVQHDRAVVFLRGQIDLAVAYDLGEICRHASQLGGDLIVDTSAMTFCDTTLFNFLACIGERLRVKVRHPTRLYLDVLALCERAEGEAAGQTA